MCSSAGNSIIKFKQNQGCILGSGVVNRCAGTRISHQNKARPGGRRSGPESQRKQNRVYISFEGTE